MAIRYGKRRAGAEQSCARRLGRPSPRPSGSRGDMGGWLVLGWRVVLPKVDFHDLHDASAARLWSAREQPAGAPGLRAASGPRTPTRWRHQLRLARAERDLHHRDGALHPVLLRLRGRPTRHPCRPPARGANVRRRVELPAGLRRDAFFGSHHHQCVGGFAAV